jgi:hypothetical protein
VASPLLGVMIWSTLLNVAFLLIDSTAASSRSLETMVAMFGISFAYLTDRNPVKLLAYESKRVEVIPVADSASNILKGCDLPTTVGYYQVLIFSVIAHLPLLGMLGTSLSLELTNLY